MSETIIAADWGTSHLRLFLCRGCEVVEQRTGPGIAALSAGTVGTQSFAATLSTLIAPWVAAHGTLPVWIAGMAGSRNGWREAAYVPCPVDARALAGAVLRFDSEGIRIGIVPGVRCTNALGAPDVMRGEETQIAGALARHPALARGRHVIALPGTHTKWALVDEGRIVRFQTGLAGELYGLLRDHSMLARTGTGASSGALDADSSHAAFERGLARTRECQGMPLIHLLFEVRSRQLVDGMPAAAALAFLSGLIIGQDVEGALSLFEGELRATPAVAVIGAPELVELYRIALRTRKLDARPVDAGEATLWGLHEISHALEN